MGGEVIFDQFHNVLFEHDTHEIFIRPYPFSPTPSPSPTISVTPSISVTPTISLTPSISLTPTPSITPSPSPVLVTTGFTTQWTVSGDDAARTITMPFTDHGTYNATIYWGDGSYTGITSYNDVNNTHTYAIDGTYIVEIRGEAPGWSMLSHADKLKLSKIIYWGDASAFGGFSNLIYGFYGVNTNTSLGTGKILVKPDIGRIDNLFLQNQFTSVPAGLLDNLVNVIWAGGMFEQTPITMIPAGLFDKMINVIDMSNMFANCSTLTNSSFPTDLFRYNTGCTNMNGMFRGWSINYEPKDAFLYNTKVTDFGYVFMGTTITGMTDSMYFRHTTGSSINFQQTFFGCPNLETIPDGLLADEDGLTFIWCFYDCPKLQINPYTFITVTGETATRFNNKSPDLRYVFQRFSFTGNQGRAPDLWNYTFGTGTPTYTECFNGAGNSSTSIINYADIPAGWL